MSALFDEHPPLLSMHGPLGSWPLECWTNGCAFPRVDGVHCRKHAPQAEKRVALPELPDLLERVRRRQRTTA